MMDYVKDAVMIIDLEPETVFVFQGDRLRPRKQYFFSNCDGHYARIFESEKHMKANRNPAFVSCSTVVLEVV